MNHEFAPGVVEDALDEVEGEATQSIPVTDHNLFDISAHDAVQKGREAGALPVDARADVFDDLVFWILFLEEFDLLDEVLFLLGTGDSRVAHFGSLVALFLCREHFESGDDVAEVAFFVEAFALHAFEADGANPPVVCPSLQRAVADAKSSSDLCPCDVLGGGSRSSDGSCRGRTGNSVDSTGFVSALCIHPIGFVNFGIL